MKDKDSIYKLTINDILNETENEAENDHHKDEMLKLFINKGIITKDTYKDYHNKEKK